MSADHFHHGCSTFNESGAVTELRSELMDCGTSFGVENDAGKGNDIPEGDDQYMGVADDGVGYGNPLAEEPMWWCTRWKKLVSAAAVHGGVVVLVGSNDGDAAAAMSHGSMAAIAGVPVAGTGDVDEWECWDAECKEDCKAKFCALANQKFTSFPPTLLPPVLPESTSLSTDSSSQPVTTSGGEELNMRLGEWPLARSQWPGGDDVERGGSMLLSTDESTRDRFRLHCELDDGLPGRESAFLNVEDAGAGNL